MNSLLSRRQIVRTVVGNVTNWSIRSSVAAGGGLEYNANGELGIKLSPNGNTVLSLGNAGLGLANQTGRTFLASPANGSLGQVTFRAIAAADLPDLTGTYQAFDSDLASLANATLSNAIYYRVAAGNWTGITFGSNITFANGVLNANIPPGGVVNIGNGTANATGNVTIAVGNNVQVGVSGNTITLSATASGGNTGSAGGLDPSTAIYPGFSLVGGDDEFNDGSFSGWTLVDSGNNTPTITETNNVISIAHPGGDAYQEIHAWLKSATITTGSYIEMAFTGVGRDQNFNLCGLILSNATTYGTGNQVVCYYSPAERKIALQTMNGFNFLAVFNGWDMVTNPIGPPCLFLRLECVGTNTWRGCVSADGVSFVNFTGNRTEVLAPTHAGIMVSTWGGTLPFNWSVRYFKVR